MFLTATQIVASIKMLDKVHPFHGITFLACKKGSLPIGQEIDFPLDARTDAFLREHHLINPKSQWLFQPFKSSKRWLRHDYSAKGLQAINTQTFGTAFLHQHNTRIWGWANNYVGVLVDKLPRKQKIPAFEMAVWLYRDFDWTADTKPKDIVARFAADYMLTDAEQQHLFDMSSSDVTPADLLQDQVVTWTDLQPSLPAPPDAQPDEGGTLALLETKGLGPAKVFEFEPASRLTLITGDNGLGKSFLLEAAWWALTGTWADRPSYPGPGERGSKVEITFAIEGEQSKPQTKTIEFDWKTHSWPAPKNRPTIAGLIVYARVDGSFAVWDPARQAMASPEAARSAKTVFSSQEVWDGLDKRIEGLIRDWVRWQSNPSTGQYATFERVLASLSPPDLGTLKPGPPVRIPDDSRDIPTIVHPYGQTPIVYASAGVKRIVTLAYLIVWAWHEHVLAAEMAHQQPQRRMVILVDEMEAHLHPRWQRAMLPALIEVNSMLAASLKAQYIIATHSPLVMASSESVFDTDTDKLFHLDLTPSGDVTLKETDYIRFGDVSSWLTSPVFELKHARSQEAETAIESAKALQLRADAPASEVRAVSDLLLKSLSPEDKFWPRWIAFAERHGVKL